MNQFRRSSLYAVFLGTAVLVGAAPASPSTPVPMQTPTERQAGLPDVPHLVGRLVRLAVREALRPK